MTVNAYIIIYLVIGALWAAAGFMQKGKKMLDEVPMVAPFSSSEFLALAVTLGYVAIALLWPLGLVMAVYEWAKER